MCLLLITSSISMQLFCFITNLKQFETFPRVSRSIDVVVRERISPQAFMSMFQIAMNDGWTEVMYTAMDEVYDFGIFFVCLTALFFIFFHLLTNSVSGQNVNQARACARSLHIWFARLHWMRTEELCTLQHFFFFLYLGIHVDVPSSDTKRLGWRDALHDDT